MSGTTIYYVTAIGNALVKSGGGCLIGQVAVQVAGSSDCVMTLLDGTSSSGTPIATISLNAQGPQHVPNYAFGKGLFLQITGTSPARAVVNFN